MEDKKEEVSLTLPVPQYRTVAAGADEKGEASSRGGGVGGGSSRGPGAVPQILDTRWPVLVSGSDVCVCRPVCLVPFDMLSVGIGET